MLRARRLLMKWPGVIASSAAAARPSASDRNRRRATRNITPTETIPVKTVGSRTADSDSGRSVNISAVR